MDQRAPQFGSGSNLLGDTSALQKLMAESGIPANALQQVSGAAPTAQPNMAPQQALGGPAPQGMAPAAQAAPSAPQGLPSGSAEADTIIKALSSRLSSISKQQEPQPIPGGI